LLARIRDAKKPRRYEFGLVIRDGSNRERSANMLSLIGAVRVRHKPRRKMNSDTNNTRSEWGWKCSKNHSPKTGRSHRIGKMRENHPQIMLGEKEKPLGSRSRARVSWGSRGQQRKRRRELANGWGNRPKHDVKRLTGTRNFIPSWSPRRKNLTKRPV